MKAILIIINSNKFKPTAHKRHTQGTPKAHQMHAKCTPNHRFYEYFRIFGSAGMRFLWASRGQKTMTNTVFNVISEANVQSSYRSLTNVYSDDRRIVSMRVLENLKSKMLIFHWKCVCFGDSEIENVDISKEICVFWRIWNQKC